MTIKNLNRQISVWRGNSTPPTNYHIWIKEDSTIWYYKDKWVILTASDDKYDEMMSLINAMNKRLDDFYTKQEADKKFLTEETDPTVPSWAKQPTKPKYTAKEVGALPDTTKIPTQTSDLTNNSGFITKNDIPNKVSAFKNDAGYITKSAIPVNVSAFKNDAKYITVADIPKKVSAFTNDAGYITKVDVPTKTSQLKNDSGFVTIDDFPKKISAFDNDKDYVTRGEVAELMGGVDSFYTKEEIDNKFVTKIEFNEKVGELEDFNSNLQDQINEKAGIASPEFTGTPKTTTPDEEADGKQITNVEWVQSYVEDQISSSNNVTVDIEDGVAKVFIGSGSFELTGGDGIEISQPDQTKKSFTITNTSKLGNHASTNTTYGIGTETEYGHLKTMDEFVITNGVVAYPGDEEGIAATPRLVYQSLNIALNAAKQDLDFANLNISANGNNIATYDPQSEGDVSFNFVGNNGITVTSNGSDIVISAPELLTLDSIHAGNNVNISQYNAEGGIQISSYQREVEAYNINEQEQTTEQQQKVIEKADDKPIRFGKGLMHKDEEIDIAWAELKQNILTYKI